MLRAVIDTSCLVSYVLTQGELMRQVIGHWRDGTFALLSSSATRAELAGVLARPAIQRLAVVPLGELVSGLTRFSEHVPGNLQLAGVCRDPNDDKFLACAVEGHAHYLVTGDRDMLSLHHHREIAIVNPGQFLLALELHQLDVDALTERFSCDVLVEITRVIPLDPDTADRVNEALARLQG
jgi:putative PIN family toxin of toxin-antitoxin system